MDINNHYYFVNNMHQSVNWHTEFSMDSALIGKKSENLIMRMRIFGKNWTC